MPVINAPRITRHLSPFMFSAAIVGALAASGLEGVAPDAPAAERFGQATGPLVLG